MPKAFRSDQILPGSIVLATFAASIFWTGFPVYMQGQLGSKYSLSEVYAFAVSGSFLFSLVAGFWADRSGYRTISALSQLASAVLIALIAFLSFRGFGVVALGILTLLYLNFALGNVMESVWLFEKLDSSDVSKKILNRGLALTSAKLVGFSLGPVVFSLSARGSLSVCVLAFAIASAAQFSIRRSNLNRVAVPSGKIGNSSSFAIFRNRPLLLAGLLVGVLSVPLNPIFAARAVQLSGDIGASAFWICAGLASLAGMLVLKRAKKFGWSNARWPATVLMAVSVAVALTSNEAGVVIAAASVYIFCLPLFSLEFHSRILKADLNRQVGGKVGLINALVEGGIFFGMCAAAASEHLGVSAQLIGIIALIILRFVSFSLPGEKLTSRA